MELEINGLTYRAKEQERQQTAGKTLPRGLMSLMLMGMMLESQVSLGSPKKEKSAPKVNIIEEYKLIMEKKSTLSKRDRDYVVEMFNKNYELI